MAGLTIEGTVGGKKRVGGRRRVPGKGVEVLDPDTGNWVRGLSGWQARELEESLDRKRSLNGRLAALEGVEDPGVLERLEHESPELAEAVGAHRERLRSARSRATQQKERR